MISVNFKNKDQYSDLITKVELMIDKKRSVLSNTEDKSVSPILQMDIKLYAELLEAIRELISNRHVYNITLDEKRAIRAEISPQENMLNSDFYPYNRMDPFSKEIIRQISISKAKEIWNF